MSTRRDMKRLKFDLEEGGAFIRVPATTDWSGRRSDNMTLTTYGKKVKSGQWVQVEVSIPRSQIDSLAHSFHEIIALEQIKVNDLKKAMHAGGV